MKKIISLSIVLIFSLNVYAISESNEKADSLQALDYPELNVVPLASDRIMTEAANEKEDTFFSAWPSLIPSTMTLINGIQMNGESRPGSTDQEKDDAAWASRAAILIGGGSLLTTFYMQRRNAASETASDLKKIQGQGRRERLQRERLAEEALEEQASLDRKLMWLTFSTEILVNGWLHENAPDDKRSMIVAASVASFIPLIFSPRSLSTYDKHLRAKRRIYIPIASVISIPGSKSAQAVGGLKWAWSF